MEFCNTRSYYEDNLAARLLTVLNKSRHNLNWMQFGIGSQTVVEKVLDAVRHTF